MITLQYSTRRTIGSALIRAATWSWASHVDIVMPTGQLLGATVPGVGIRKPESDIARAERFTLDLPLDEVIDVAAPHIGAPYDWVGVLGIGVHRDWQDPSAWFCSEFIEWIAHQLGRPLLRTHRVWRITPAMQLLSPMLKPQA